MNRKLLNGFLVLAVAAGGVGTFTSCKDEDFRNDLALENASLQAQIDAIREISDSEFNLALNEWLDARTKAVSAGLDPDFATYRDLVVAVSTMKNLYDKIMAGDITGNAATFAENLWNYFYNNHVKDLVDGLQSQITVNAQKIAALEEALKAQGLRIDDLETRMTAAEGEIVNLWDAVNKLGGDVQKLQDDYFALVNRINGLEDELKQLENTVEGLATNLSELMTAFAEYQTRVNTILDNLLERASSVSISQTYNPVFGTINLPVGLSTKVLATYDYKSSHKLVFPTEAMSWMASASPINEAGADVATWANIIKTIAGTNTVTLDANTMYFTDANEFGNMGGAVVTVNPVSVDFTDADKYTVSLVNSKMESILDGGVSLSNYDDVLYFGASRADNSGVYALNADVTEATANGLFVDVDKTSLKAALKQAIADKTISNIAHLGETVFKALNNQLPAYAVKVAWTEDVETEDLVSGTTVYTPQENYVLSDFEVAAVVAHPLSYGSEIDKFIPGGKSLPHISPLAEYLERIQNKLDLTFEGMEGVQSVEVKFEFTKSGIIRAEVIGMPDAYIELSYGPDGIQMGDEGYDESLNYFIDQLLSQLGSQSQDQMDDMVEQINNSIQKINDQLKDYEGKVGRINDYLEEVKNSKKLSYAQKLVDIYNEVADKVNDFLANPNHYLQVMMAYSTGDGAHHLSTDYYSPVKFNSKEGDAFSLFATSYTGDVVIPSYKKWVAITQVDGDYTKVGSLNNGQTYLNKVLPGHQQRVPVKITSEMVGHTLTISYVSVDYRGVCSMQNYYVYVY